MSAPLVAALTHIVNKKDDDRALKTMAENNNKDWKAGAIKYAEELRKMGILLRRLGRDGEKYFDENGDLIEMPYHLARRTPEEYASIFNK